VHSFFLLFRIIYFILSHKWLINADVKVNIRVKTSQEHEKLLSSGRCCTFRQQVGCMWDWHSMRFIQRFAAKLIKSEFCARWNENLIFSSSPLPPDAVPVASSCSALLPLCFLTTAFSEISCESSVRAKTEEKKPFLNRRFFAYGFLKSSGWLCALQIFPTSFTTNYLGFLRNFVITLVNKD